MKDLCFFDGSGNFQMFSGNESGRRAFGVWVVLNGGFGWMSDELLEETIKWQNSFIPGVFTESDPIQDFISRRIARRQSAHGDQILRDVIESLGRSILPEEDGRGEGLERSDPWVNRQSHRIGYRIAAR